VHEILKTDFNMPDGLANKDVTLLDPPLARLPFLPKPSSWRLRPM